MEELIELFKKFPGIGGRQAKRFVYFLMHTQSSYRQELINAINNINNKVITCDSCNRKFIDYRNHNKCNVCNKNRDKSILLILAYDNDIETFENTLAFNGEYFILGKYIPLFSDKINEYVDFQKIYERIDNLLGQGLKEIIIGLNATSDGNFTNKVLKEKISEKYKDKELKISTLGRGISTGGEIEYTDSDTLREALRFRR